VSQELCAVPGCDLLSEWWGVCEPHRREELALEHLEEELAFIEIDAEIGAQTDREMIHVSALLVRFEDADGTPYGCRALANACLELAGTDPGQRNMRLNALAYAQGRLVGGGELRQERAERDLLAVAVATGLQERYALDTIRRAMRKGMARPKILPPRRGR
jgi:hypothetical protein